MKFLIKVIKKLFHLINLEMKIYKTQLIIKSNHLIILRKKWMNDEE